MVNIEGIIPVTLPQIIPICIAALPLNMFKPSSGFLLTVPRRCFFCGFFVSYVSWLSLLCGLVCSLQHLWSHAGKGMVSWLPCVLCFHIVMSLSHIY